jgi:hypothetical protein
MKKFLVLSLLLVATLWLASCTDSDVPLTEVQQAESYNLSVPEYKKMKNAAAQMNMTIENHMKMVTTDDMSGMDHSSMDMWDDSSMIEDDSEEKGIMPKWAHNMPDGTVMMPDWSTISGSHIMEDGEVMTDNAMHMEMMHEWEVIEEHWDDKHGDHELK